MKEYGLSNDFKQVFTKYDPDRQILWSYLSQEGMIPNFNSDICAELTKHNKEIEQSAGYLKVDGQLYPVNYSIAASKRSDVFSLGGPLVHIHELAKARRREALEDYAVKAVSVLAQRVFHYNIPSLITISLVQGLCLGAGFETALSSDIVIAEKQSNIGFPEIAFNMFPGMGAYSLISRKVGNRIADKMILGGEIYTAEECYEMGLVDVLAEEGQGEQALYDWIRSNRNSGNGFLASQKAKNRVNPITWQELHDITQIWLDAAMRLTDRDLRMIERFIGSQQKRYGASSDAQSNASNVVEIKRSA